MTVERVTDLVRYRTIADRETARHQGMTDLQVDAALGYARDRRTIFAIQQHPRLAVANGLRAVPPGAEATPLDGRKPRERGLVMHWHNVRYEIGKRVERTCLAVARRMPGQLRMWVVVDATNEARRLYPHPTGYAGPDGLEYRHIHDGALRRRLP